jgi:hypothetical protein
MVFRGRDNCQLPCIASGKEIHALQSVTSFLKMALATVATN